MQKSPIEESPGAEKTRLVTCQTPQSVKLSGTLLRVTNHEAVFEFYDPHVILRTSEVLEPFKILVNEQTIYSGRAVAENLVVTGSTVLCAVNLDPSGFTPEWLASALRSVNWCTEFGGFIGSWQKNYRIVPDYKVAIADLHTFLADLRLWLEQVELAVRSSPTGDRLKLEQATAHDLSRPVIPALTTLFEKAEAVTARVPPEEQPAYRSFMQRQLHPLLLCSPFVYRTYFKPLGYAGDYEMVNMMTRDPCEGGSLFAKVVNSWFVAQAPAEAHRQRLDYLVQKLTEVTLRTRGMGRPARIYNLGCGPAVEIQRFLAEIDLADQASFTLVDFNEETIAYAHQALESARQKAHRSTPLKFIRKSVAQLLKGVPGVESSANQHDLVYCAGLTDYLSDSVCRRLIALLYSWVTPGGLLIITNVDGSNPRHETMKHVLAWHLIYRSSRQLAGLRPDGVPDDEVKVYASENGVNNYLEIRKPAHV